MRCGYVRNRWACLGCGLGRGCDLGRSSNPLRIKGREQPTEHDLPPGYHGDAEDILRCMVEDGVDELTESVADVEGGLAKQLQHRHEHIHIGDIIWRREKDVNVIKPTEHVQVDLYNCWSPWQHRDLSVL